MTDTYYPVFDGHNDTLLRLVMAQKEGNPISFIEGSDTLHIDQPKAKEGRFAGGFFASFVPPKTKPGEVLDFQARVQPLEQPYALEVTMSMMACALRLEQQDGSNIKICLSSDDVDLAMKEGKIALLLHIEGAEAIDGEFESLDVLHAAGLRSIGPVWSRSNIFGHGVPFNFPGSPDTGPGLTDLGKELVRRCNAMGILIDLSHLNEKGFWDIHAIGEKPLIATHSNVHALCPSPRNLTDKQLAAIAETNGLVGLNYSVGFLREDGDKSKIDMSLDIMVDHLAYLVDKLGEDGVGLGSDFDGTTIPQKIGSCAGNKALIDQMRQRGFGETLIEKIAYKNWLALLKRSGL
ncbi:dipeptidase [uncultured Cohaesibacter sp.]|uniref:dipeptidase n=1 Tax=uncultured Cohaesibacter sp. TaxID=1002546 RepID=UPI002930187E|nr:dipeptidase [uncultured Cohaesibacter sp.]